MAGPIRPKMIEDLKRRLAEHALVFFGGFHPTPGENDLSAGTVFLVGNVGSAIWPHIQAFDDGCPDPLDRWTRDIVTPLATDFGARAVFPFDTPPLPFQTWARRAAPVHPSPLGILIHPDHGLWHAYRAALLFEDVLDLGTPDHRPSPCDTCAERPCLTTCPVGAFTDAGYDVPVCAAHLKQLDPSARDAGHCMAVGCLARLACPVAPHLRYALDHAAFHMTAFLNNR